METVTLMPNGKAQNATAEPLMTVYLYGSFASYVTAKTRCYLLKKGIPFIERTPGHPRFRAHVRANTLNHRIPQLELAELAIARLASNVIITISEVTQRTTKQKRYVSQPCLHSLKLKLMGE